MRSFNANIPRGRANTCGANERVENKSCKVAFAMTRRTTRYAPILQSPDNGVATLGMCVRSGAFMSAGTLTLV